MQELKSPKIEAAVGDQQPADINQRSITNDNQRELHMERQPDTCAPPTIQMSPSLGERKGQVRLTSYRELPADLPPDNSNNSHKDHVQQVGGGLYLQGRDPILDTPNSKKQHQANLQDDHFQVVWSRLSFAVAPSAYEKIFNWISGNKLKLNPDLDQSKGSSSSSEKLPSQSPSVKRTIFENLNGYIKSGELTAILGPSGAGKTSLLNAICGRSVDNYRGQIAYVGSSKEQRRLRLSIVPQKDYLMENLTVFENLSYATRILNPDDSASEHAANIERVVEMLNLGACLHSRAGNISGGEYKRTSVAQELLRQPDILVLDEPTSGLDSLSSKKLISSLARIADPSYTGSRPIAILMTIHQPDIAIFHMFDHVYCMARGGRVIFDGRPDDALKTVQDHANISEGHFLPARASGSIAVNPATLLIEIASGELYGQEPIERLAQVQLAQVLESDQLTGSQLSRGSSSATLNSLATALEFGSRVDLSPATALDKSSGDKLKAKQSSSSSSSDNHQKLRRDKRLAPNSDQCEGHFWYHARVLTGRSFKSIVRDPLLTLASLVFHLTIPFVFAAVYSKRVSVSNGCPVIQRELDLVSMASNRTLERLVQQNEEVMSMIECSILLFLVTYCFSFVAIAVSSLAFPLSMHILLKEVRNGWFKMNSFIMAKTLASFPFEVLLPVISVSMVYTLLDLPGAGFGWRLWAMALVVALLAMISHTYGLIFGALAMDSSETAVFLATVSTLPMALLSGLVARIRFMPTYLQWLSWFSQYRYSSELTAIIRFGYGICPCTSATDEYLRTGVAQITDVPVHLRPTFVGVLMENAIMERENATTSATSTGTLNNSATGGGTLSANPTALAMIPGVDYNFLLSSNERYSLLEKMDLGEVDLFANMAQLMSRAFSYGHSLDEGCTSVRSLMLITDDTLPDEYLPLLFLGMFGLLVASKLLLVITVKYRIASRI